MNVRKDFLYHDSIHSYIIPPSFIHLFGASNGICSSITESKHIQAVKEPWCCSSHNKPLEQMLFINQCLDKLVDAYVDFKSREMLDQ